MAKRVTTRFKGPAQYRRTFIRQWREHRGLTLEALADRVGEKIGGMTHASLSRIERGRQPYSQLVLEAIAEALNVGVADLLIRNPGDPDAIWSIWDHAKPGEREAIVDMAEAYLQRSRKRG